jgi:hypothetical protein
VTEGIWFALLASAVVFRACQAGVIETERKQKTTNHPENLANRIFMETPSEMNLAAQYTSKAEKSSSQEKMRQVKAEDAA